MSTESPKEDKTEEVEETTVTTKTTVPKGFLGLNFNDPLVLSASLIAGGIFGALIWTMIRNFLFNKPAATATPQVDPTNKKEVNVTVTPEQLRQAQYNRDVEIAATNMLAKDINTIERNNKQINNYATTPPHYYDQYYNSYARGPTVPVYEDEIEIVDDNAPVVVQQTRETYFRPEPSVVRPNPPVAVQVKKPEAQAPPVPQQQESIDITAGDEIEEITNNEPDLSKIPPEFINVGNSETAFDKIQPNKEEKKKDAAEDIDFENLEMDEATLNQMTANAFVASKDDYY